MASSSGASSGSSAMQNSGSEGDLKALMDQRKRKRMISNRESARRSRLRKQKHLDDLMGQVAQLSKENHQIITSINITTQHYLTIESENSVLRAQLNELSHRLESLNEIISFLNTTNNGNSNNFVGHAFSAGDHYISTATAAVGLITEPVIDNFINPLSFSYLNQPIMAYADCLF